MTATAAPMIRDPYTVEVLERLRAIAPALEYDNVHRALSTFAALGAPAEDVAHLLELAIAAGIELEDLTAYAIRVALA